MKYISPANKEANIEKLLSYGFIKHKNSYKYTCNLQDGAFNLEVLVTNSQIDFRIFDKNLDGEYTPAYIPGAQGKFVGKIREEYENILAEILEKCFVGNVFESDYAKEIINFVKKNFGIEPEYLWDKFPKNAVFRDAASQKWFAAILTAPKKTIGIDKEGEIEVINLKAPPQKVAEIVDRKSILGAYHMNKKHWFTIPLDKTVPLKEIYKYIELSRKTVLK